MNVMEFGKVSYEKQIKKQNNDEESSPYSPDQRR
jgi:hypothetical protein